MNDHAGVRASAAVVLALMLEPGMALAQAPAPAARGDAADIRRLGEFIRSEGHLDQVRGAIQAFEPRALAEACADIRVVKGRSWQPVEPPLFENAAAKAPRTAAWQETWEVLACGRATVRSVGFVARPDVGVVPLPMFPGESLADLKLQVEAGQMALDMVAPSALPCQERGRIQIIASTVTNRGDPGRGRWSERWTVAGCGKTGDIDVDFLPGPQGRPTYEFQARGQR